jgi:hypothetical protein
MTDAPYDSTADTREHIAQVGYRLFAFSDLLEMRVSQHDRSKLGPVEKPLFDEMTPKLKTLVYGTPEYKDSLKALGPALKHHYEKNSHHPEFYGEQGIAGMCLLDLVEMYCDWQAATLRGKDGDFAKGLSINEARFKMDPQLASIFRNTFERHGDLANQPRRGDRQS